MKVIDLLNKIANGEEVPKKIKYDDEEFVFTGYNSASKNYNNELEDLFEVLDGSMLNDEVEIIEEKKIPEKLNKQHFHKKQRQLANKINEIIDYLDYLKSKGDQ